LIELVAEDAVIDARLVERPGHLEGHEAAVVADHRVGRLVARVRVEIGQPFPGLLGVERSRPDVDMALPIRMPPRKT
jgi:hypothetical protein